MPKVDRVTSLNFDIRIYLTGQLIVDMIIKKYVKFHLDIQRIWWVISKSHRPNWLNFPHIQCESEHCMTGDH